MKMGRTRYTASQSHIEQSIGITLQIFTSFLISFNWTRVYPRYL